MDNSIIPTPRIHKTDLKFWFMWVIASTSAILISAGVIFGLIFTAKAISPSINEDRFAGGIMLPITATIFGVCQWLVLRSRISKSGWWIPATVVGLGGGIALATVAVQAFFRITGEEDNWSIQPGVLTLYVIIGFLVSLLQLPILWRHFRGSLFWLLASMIGWLVLGFIVDISIDRTSDIFAIGAIPAIFTGFCLIWLMRYPRIEPEHSP